MKPTWLYQMESVWIVAALFIAMIVAAEIACRLGRRWYPRADDLRRAHLGAVPGPLLGLLALLLSFTFSMSANRYDARRQLVVQHANVLGGLYLESSLLPDAALSQPPVHGVDAMLKGLVDASSIQRERFLAFESRVPDPVIWLLLWGSLVRMVTIGLAGGLGNHRGLPARIIVSLLLCGTIYVVLDLDKPHQGLIRVSQTPMLRLQQELDRDPETNP